MISFYCSKITLLILVYNILVFNITGSFSTGNGRDRENPMPAITDIISKPIWNATETDLIKRALLQNYDKFSRPAQHSKGTTVYLGLNVLHVDIDEYKSSFSIFCWARFSWMDEKLKWNATDFGDVKLIRLADHEIWQPDVVVYNGADGNSVDHYSSTHSIVGNDGNVIWVPPSQFNVFCDLNFRYWPFDTQICELKLGSWTYDGNQIDLQMTDGNSSEIELLISNTEWQLTKLRKVRKSITYPCCEEPYPHISYNFTVVRNSPTYRAIVVTPAFIIVFMTLSTFWLPPHAGEKILLNGCVAIINCLILMYLTHKIPPLRLHTPLVILFFTNNLYLTCFSTIISVIVIHISRTKHNTNLPWFIKKLLTGWLGRILNLQISSQNLMSHRVNAEELKEQSSIVFDEHLGNDDHQMISSSSTKKNYQQDWFSFATTIDRLSFVLYTFIYIILAIMYSF